MGAFLDKPKTEKYNESKTGAGLRYGLSSMQGWRIEMEDAHSAIIGIPEIGENMSWFAVFDGHAGSRVSAHCATQLLETISSKDDFKESLKKEHQLSEEELMEKVNKTILYDYQIISYFILIVILIRRETLDSNNNLVAGQIRCPFGIFRAR